MQPRKSAKRFGHRLKPWSSIAMLAAVVTVATFGLHSYRYRFVRTNADMLRFLPAEDGTIFFANVKALRHSGMLALLAGVRPAEEPEYLSFVRQTGFNYKQDLDAIAGEAEGERLLLVLRGHFNWNRLQEYAINHGGSCRETVCRLAARKAGYWAWFFPIQPDVLALAFGPEGSYVSKLGSRVHASFQLPPQPVWVKVSPAILKNPTNLPVPLRIFAISVQGADRVMLSLSAAAENSGASFNVRLDAACPSQATAEALRNQLQIQTKMLRLELARERQAPNSADLTGMLTSGSFQVAGSSVVGAWPVSSQLLRNLQ